MNRLPLAFVLLAGAATLAGCPDNPYSYTTWTKQLNNQQTAERATTELEQLGDPKAIPALGEAWKSTGKPVRLLQVIISLARPLTPEEAKAKFVTDFEKTGRKASWDAAMPYLKEALTGVDEANPRSVDSATKAADALGEAGLSDGLDALIDISNKPLTKKLIAAQIGAVRAMGKFTNDKPKSAGALQKIIDRDPPAHPKTAKNKEEGKLLGEKYEVFLAMTGAAINALGELRTAGAAKTLVLSMYRTPELFTQIRRSLVSTGPAAEDELRKILRGEHTEVNQLFKDKKMDVYCGDKGDAPADQCQKVSAKDFYPAVVLGDFYDPKSTPDLLAALSRPPLPVYFTDEQASPNTQYNAVFDSLRKIGATDAATKVKSMWISAAAGAPAPKKKAGAGDDADGGAGADDPDLNVKILAVSAYPFLVRDTNGVEELAKIASDNHQNDQLRQEAATAYARLARDASAMDSLDSLADKYFKASVDKRKEADGKPKTDADAADKIFEAEKKKRDDAKQALVVLTNDKTKSIEQIKAATADVKKIEEAFKDVKKKHTEGTAAYKQLDGMAKDYKRFARMFQTHIARIEVAIRCQSDLKCYVATLKETPDDAAKNAAKYIKDIKDWTDEEKKGLVEANIERAMLEIGKQGAKAADLTDTLLDAAKSDSRLVRQSVLLALPKIAKVPCGNCEAKLDAAIKEGEGKSALGDLNLETTMMRNYFSWAGGKTPSSAPAEAPPAEAPAEAPAKK